MNPPGLLSRLEPHDADALRLLWSLLPDSRLVGGVVRDLMVGLRAVDIDLATALPPQTVLDRLRDARLTVVPTGIAHGTVTAVIARRPYEITTLRRDVETDGRHAVVAWTDDWRADAARRDFTINAMSLSPDGVLHDHFGGADDLAAGRVRFVGEAGLRLAEDGLRILRFFRFEARFGRGTPDEAALSAIQAGLACLAPLSPERVAMELERLLAGPSPDVALRLMQRTGVLRAILPGADPEPVAALIARGAPADAMLRLAALTVGADEPAAVLAQRLRLSRAKAERLEKLRRPPVPTPDLDDDALRRLLAREPAELLIDRTWLAGPDDPLRERLRAPAAAGIPARRPRCGADRDSARTRNRRGAGRGRGVVAPGRLPRRPRRLPGPG